MLFDIKNVVKICTTKKISPNQLLYMYCIYSNDWASIYELFHKLEQLDERNPKLKIKGFDFEHEIKPLVDEGYLINYNKDANGIKWNKLKKEDFDNFEITDKFKELIFVNSFDAVDELFKAYPPFIKIDGRNIPSMQGAEYKGNYLGKDELGKLYLNKINYSHTQHIENLNGIEKAKKANVQFPVLRKYILDEMWLSFNALEDSTINELNDNITLKTDTWI